jgi:hypothetical protein
VFILPKRILATLTALADRARTASVGPLSVEFDQIAVGALQDTARQAAQSFGSDPDRLGDFLGEQIAKMAEQRPKQDERSISGSRILWADDNIGHNLFEMHYIQRLGARIETAATTEEALQSRRRIPLVLYTANAVLLRGDPDVASYGAVATDTANELFAEVRNMLSRSETGLRRIITRQRRAPEATS